MWVDLARLWAAVAVAVIVGWSLPAVAQKPPLAEVAKKEQERRKAAPEATKKLTNKDLPESAVKPKDEAPQAGTAPSAEQPSAGEAARNPEATPAEDEKNEAWWRSRITEAREELRRNEMFAEALQSRINGLTTEFVNRDDPFQRGKIGEDRQKAIVELERVRAEIAVNQKQIESIEEEARKAGVPPGWLR